ncbi:MAG: hypothetical protein SOY64_04275 [Pyramidobacter sp.]|nr:hypothetical protein [Pyramidobacter sp. YE332]MDY4032274.1 hypothetical protein [Pyramidobacter sp.]WOL40984.1 hypothetical protein RAH42_04925 [Pyramidobacter sp. YE332]
MGWILNFIAGEGMPRKSGGPGIGAICGAPIPARARRAAEVSA